MVSHLLEKAVFLADRIAVVKTGRLIDIINISPPRPRSKEHKDFMLDVLKVEKTMEQ